jgi:hypothetical protein
MATKKQIKTNMKRLHSKMKQVMQQEKLKNFIYIGKDDNFADSVSHAFGTITDAIDDIETVIDHK